MAEHLTVDQVVVGSTPIWHPKNKHFISTVPYIGIWGSWLLKENSNYLVNDLPS
jgi:hypothetical protein